MPADIRRGRESLAQAIRQSEGLEPGAPGFDWDVMVDAGDLSASQFPPTDEAAYGGGAGFHGASGGVEGSGYLYFVIENDDPDDFRYTTSEPGNPGPFEVFLDHFHGQHGCPAIDLWVGGHSHAMQPLPVYDGKGLIERRWAVSFLQASALTRHHGGGLPMSRLLTFRQGQDSATANAG